MPSWIRAAEIILGLVSLVAGVYVLAYPLVAVFTLIVLLAVGLIFLGARDIVLGAMGKFLPSWLRAANIVLGVLAFILSLVVINETWIRSSNPYPASLRCLVRAWVA